MFWFTSTKGPDFYHKKRGTSLFGEGCATWPKAKPRAVEAEVPLGVRMTKRATSASGAAQAVAGLGWAMTVVGMLVLAAALVQTAFVAICISFLVLFVGRMVVITSHAPVPGISPVGPRSLKHAVLQLVCSVG